MRVGIVEFSTLSASFEQDLAAYADAGAEAIGICEIKLEQGREDRERELFRRSGLAASCAIPAVPSILPIPAAPSPERAEERVEAILGGMRRLAPFDPSAFVCLTGWPPSDDEIEGRRQVVEGLRVLSEEAERLGIPVGVEPMSARFRKDWTVVTTLGETAALIDEIGSDRLGITFDTWHLWDTPSIEEEIENHGSRIVCIHVADWRAPTRSWCDRVLPGEGAADLPSLFDALERAGWNGFYDLEIFSDNGAFGHHYEDSLWDVPAAELAARGRQAMLAAFTPRRPVF